VAARTKDAFSGEFLTEEVTIRGVTYKFRELTGAQYEECLKLAEGPDGDANLSTVLRLMIPLSLVDPKLSAEQIYEKPLPVVSAIQNVVNQMHFKTEPVKKAEDEGDGVEPKNDSEPQSSSS